MTWRTRGVALSCLIVAIAGGGPPAGAAAQEPHRRIDVLGPVEPGWAEAWTEQRLAPRGTTYRPDTVAGRAAFEAASEAAASGLWRSVTARPDSVGRISWSWKVEQALVANDREREQAGDDYAARVFIVFDGEPFGRGTRALVYVWASTEPVESRYPNPFAGDVVTIVVESGQAHWGSWRRVRRDFLADYRAAFGGAPERVTAVALLVDTDNTGGRASAWFTDVALEVDER